MIQKIIENIKQDIKYSVKNTDLLILVKELTNIEKDINKCSVNIQLSSTEVTREFDEDSINNNSRSDSLSLDDDIKPYVTRTVNTSPIYKNKKLYKEATSFLNQYMSLILFF